MLHLLLYGLLAIVLAAALFGVAARFLPAGEQIAPPVRDEPPWELPPDRAMSADDVDGVRLPVALRGYRFAETDLLLDRLAGELRARDAELARLRGELPLKQELPPSWAPAETEPGEAELTETPMTGGEAEVPVGPAEADLAVAGPVAEAAPADQTAANAPVEQVAAAVEPNVEDQLADELSVHEAMDEIAPAQADEPPAAAVVEAVSEAVPDPAGYWTTNAPPWAVAPAPWVAPAPVDQPPVQPPPAEEPAAEKGPDGTPGRRRRRRRRS